MGKDGLGKIGEAIELGSHTFEAESTTEFAAQFDPQPFHLSDEAARNSHFGRLAASGWQTCAIWQKLMVENGVKVGKLRKLEDIKWVMPVFAGDTINYKFTVTEQTETEIIGHVEVFNQDKKLVMSMEVTMESKTN